MPADWRIGELKTKAWEALRGVYWKALLVALVIAVAGGVDVTSNGGGIPNVNGVFRNINRSSRISSSQSIERQMEDSIVGDSIVGDIYGVTPEELIESEAGKMFVTVAAIIGIVVMLLAFLFRVFLLNLLVPGGLRYFVDNSEKLQSGVEANMSVLGMNFRKGNYKNTMLTMLRRDIFTFLWSLLFIIPGIIKAYSYSMVPFILADNPNIGSERAIELSMQMTQGEKFDMFVLGLSFLGWYILGVIACFVGVIFVHPYVQATKAELYRVLREKALSNRYCTYEELGFGGVAQ